MPPNSATALSSTTAALTLAPAHERREAREVDALLEAQRQRVTAKDEEVRRLKRHVHALSKQTPADRKQTHAYLDRHKARKGKKAGGKGSGGGKKGQGERKQKQGGGGEEQNGEDDKAAETADNGKSLYSTTQSTGSSVVTVDDDNDDDTHEDDTQQQEEQRDRTVDLYDQTAATLDRRIQSSDSHSPTATQSGSPFTLASSAPQSPRAEGPSADVEQLAEALEQLKQLTAKQQQTITILQQQQHHTPQQQQPPKLQQPTRRPPPAADSLWSKEVESLLLDKYSREAASSAAAGGRGERMREVRRVLRETIGNLEEKLDEVEKWKRAALQAECERMQAIEEMKRVRTNLRQQQQQVEQTKARQAVVEEEEEDEEEEEEEEDEDEDDDDEPMLPLSPPKRSSLARSPAKSPTKARESRPPAAAAAVEEKEAATNELAVASANPSSVYASSATTSRSSAAPLPSITTHSSSATTSCASITTAVTGQSPVASLAQSPTTSGIVASTAAFTSASQSTTTMSTVTSHPTFQPSPLPSPPFSTSASALLPVAAFSLAQHTPTAVTVEVSQGELNPHFFLFSPSAPPPHTFLSCHLPPSPPSFSGLFGGHAPTYRLMCQLPPPADVRQRLVVALYAQVRGTVGGGGESAKVGEAELDVWQATAAGGGTGTLQLWWEGDDKESMTPQERLIATLPYTVRPSTTLAVEESKQQLSYVDNYSTRTSASPPASSSVRGSRRSSLIDAPVLPKFSMTLTIASCSVVRLSRLQLRSQCSLSDFNAPLTALAASPSSPTGGCLHRLSLSLHYLIAQCIDQLLRLHMSIDSVTAPPVGYFDIPLRLLLSDTSAGTSGGRCEGVRQQQWSVVHEPGTDVHIGSIEYGLQWSVTPGTF